ncbi:histone-lysine N-methyltransferase, H3 lysine-9 specific SUVH6-like [Typha latifolia]|uniref:histone-lysine N-methyltransferase, H3 lysine-9 specific SUVH6-like n=1 Tax=Typha latifolia TaxID=4733 RepID=UPI003C2BD084
MGECVKEWRTDCEVRIMPKRRKALAAWRFGHGLSIKARTLNRNSKANLGPGVEFSGQRSVLKDLRSLKSNGCVQIMYKRRKGLAAWRFQHGYRHPFSKEFISKKYHKAQESPIHDGMVSSLAKEKSPSPMRSPSTPDTGAVGRQTPRRYPSRVRVSAECSFSSGLSTDSGPSSDAHYSMIDDNSQVEMEESQFASGKVEKELEKKRRIEKDAHPEVGVHKKVIARVNVKESLQEFQRIYRKLLEEEESGFKENGQMLLRKSRLPDLVAFKLFRERTDGQNDIKRYFGNVPGVHIGDVFHLRVELCVVGLHRQHRLGVDYVRQHEKPLAVSVVSYGNYADANDNFDVLVYPGSVVATNGNLALKSSMESKTPVRVIHGFIKYQSEKFRETKTKKLATYIYGGLYLVEKCWNEKGSDHQDIYMFQLRRIPGQPKLDIGEILKSKRSETFSGLYIEDISQGKEKIPISVVNAVDDERPMPFKYITRTMYPLKHLPTPARGCDCSDGCMDSDKCACAINNGGEIPFNHRGAIVEAKPLVYECGPSCKCPPTCHNRVSQHGIKFQLQIFKTRSMGWGVRSLNFIPSGSFVCEYVGELLEDEEAQKRTNDEYLFAVGNNYYDESLWEGLSTSIPSLQKGPSCKGDEVGFAVDASMYGNIGRFFNHSCTPNLYAQNLLYDHDNKSMPHIMFFASEDIPALEELTYHYNYTIDQVYDSNGNIKKKDCYCGSAECTGRLY